MLTGTCYCGAARYATDDEARDATVCHCADCRRIAGAPSVAWFSVRRSALRWTAGEPVIFRSSPKVERAFCGTCGTCLTWWGSDEAEWIDVTIASLDDPARVPPRSHTFAGERIGWDVIGDGLPRFERTRHGESRETAAPALLGRKAATGGGKRIRPDAMARTSAGPRPTPPPQRGRLDGGTSEASGGTASQQPAAVPLAISILLREEGAGRTFVAPGERTLQRT